MKYHLPAELGDVVEIPKGAWFQENSQIQYANESMSGCVVTPRAMMSGTMFNGLVEVYLTVDKGRRIQVYENIIHIIYRGKKRGY